MSQVTTVTVRYWAGAKAAAGVAQERLEATDVPALRAAMLDAHPALEPVLRVASVLVDGRAAHEDTPLTSASAVEVLPPFAGG